MGGPPRSLGSQKETKHIKRKWDEVVTVGVTKCFWVNFLKIGVCALCKDNEYIMCLFISTYKYCSNNVDKICLEYKLHFLD